MAGFSFSAGYCNNFLTPQLPKTTPPPPLLSLSCRATAFPILSKRISVPARDTVIDFGKHKGKMLGTLPSTWVSKNLRTRDFQEWAQRADEVLADPVYRDRIEWEFAEKVLNGEVSRATAAAGNEDAVSSLLEISERFGWDNEDKVGWSKIDFTLLGTTKGGRIPRNGSSTQENESSRRVTERTKRDKSKKVRDSDEDARRRERRERVRIKRFSSSASNSPNSDDSNESGIRAAVETKTAGVGGGGKGSDGGRNYSKNEQGKPKTAAADEEEVSPSPSPSSIGSRFPGRRGLINKVMNLKRR